MSRTTPKSLIFAAKIAAVASTASASTLGQQLANGSISEQAFHQLVANSGLSESEAQTMTVHEVLQVKFKDD
jgi:hypothetical protein